ncbi:DNA helicase [Mycolicibacterium doricum]|uniref:Helicase n=1 Tax=Mycolicibacterium doricum TaxID=126673 RepID=A0A1X1TJL6_9MYCO|nr:DEAD/DEAH box helicase [Mycolicibacterium doricum]MCV7267078.1 DEAD/DEAH box helicase [Mycolicibacterium doricum]ORV44713.1 helicase [Mycolicibacterium doricum]BBZ08846.1 DNA helicase [Mycolicibacterium doricum]
MQTLTYPRISLDDAVARLGRDTVRHGTEYAHSGRVLRCLWSPNPGSLVGSVRGNHGRTYATTVHLVREPAGTWALKGGRCSCPMQLNCKHVAALVVTAAGTDQTPAPRADWRQSLDALLPEAVGRTGASAPYGAAIPLGIQLELVAGDSSPTLEARVVRPGKRGGWVGSDVNWSNLATLVHNGYHPEHIEKLRKLFALLQSPATGGYLPYSHGPYSYGVVKTIDLGRLNSAQLWPLLTEARRVGVRLVHAGTGQKVAMGAAARVNLDVATDSSGALTVRPVLEVDGASVTVAAFIGSPAHGVAYGDQVLRIAPLAAAAPTALQSLIVRNETLVIPADSAEQFAVEYFPRLRSVAAVTSSDGSFTAPEITGPQLVLSADYRAAHQLALTWSWSYRVGDKELRTPFDTFDDIGVRDLDAERELAADISAPLERCGLRDDTGALTATILAGVDTMRFATELQPMLGATDGVTVEITGEPADYREAGGSLQIGVRVASVSGETDWFDLGITISVEGNKIPLPRVLAALTAGHDYLLLDDGAYIALDKPELLKLRALVEEARALNDGDDRPRISRFQAGLFDDLAGLATGVRQAKDWRRQVAGLRELQTLDPIAVPNTLNAELRPYQHDGFAWLATLYDHGLGGILADDMGLGKTVQTLALMCHARQRAAGRPFLVVAPASVLSNWVVEAARFAPGLKVVTVTDTLGRSGANLDQLVCDADVVVTSYTLFRLDCDAHGAQAWSGLILDEAQYVKNRHAKTHQCARKLQAPFKLAITGTPMENNLMELWSLLAITAPGLFPDPDKFAGYYAKPIEKSGDAELLELFRRRIKPLVKRRTKALVAPELPAKQEQILNVELTPRHRKIYDIRLQRERQKVLGLLDDIQHNRFTILKSLTVLRQLALHPGLVDPAHTGLPSAKIDALVEHLREVVSGGHRALVFSQFTRFLGQVRDRLDAEGIASCYLDGRTRDRAKAIQRFKDGDAPVFLISLKAGGFGLNLTEADYCFLLDPWWNPAVEAQAVDRIHRIGQTRTVMAYRLIARDTIEDKVLALNTRKAELFASVIDGGNAFGSALSADDIRELIS